MSVALLRGENIRLYRNLEIEPHPQLNLIIGGNAAGKTTLLEALFVTGRGRSFRAQSLSELSGPARTAWTTFMDVRDGAVHNRIGVGWSREGTEIRLNEGKNARLTDVIRAIPMQLIDPTAHRLLDEAPSYRRSFVDWGVFHVEHRFHEIWRRFQNGLRQRNSALREGLADRVVQAWNEELSMSAELLNEMRETHIEASRQNLIRWSEFLIGGGRVRCDWQRGWSSCERYREVLDRNLEQHRKMGTTAQGPHRAELKISFSDVKAKGRVSRGQQKMLVSAMVLAQMEVLVGQGVTAPVILLDDFASELSTEFQTRLASALAQYPGQKFITAFDFPAAFKGRDSALFHVEHGMVRRLH
ncbi:MAG: DNA replication/repair protein RecF [Panacagrimonas sp.]